MAKPKRESAKEARKEKIMAAAARVFSEKGYTAASVTEIIEGAQVARRTFYSYFDSKKEVFLELIGLFFSMYADVLKENHDRFVRALEGGELPVEAWRRYALAVLRFHADNRELTSIVYGKALGQDEQFTAKVGEISKLARGMIAEEFAMLADRGMLIPCDIELAATMINGAMINIVRDYVLKRKRRSLKSLADELVRVQARALAPVRGAVDAQFAGPASAKRAGGKA